MDIIVENYFEKFLAEYQINSGNKSKNFEKFINYCVLSTKNISSLDLPSVNTGEGDDCSTDGIAISINNKYVSNLTELTDIINLKMEIDVEFHFIQTKMSSCFSGEQILNFGHGVLDLFKAEGENNKRRNEKIKEKCEMIQLILKNFDCLQQPPVCNLYYVTTGKYKEDKNLKGDINKVKKDLKEKDLFKKVNFFRWGKDKIRELYESSKYQNKAKFTLNKKIETPYIDGIKEGYLALMPIKELVTLLSDGENDTLKRGIFDSNVRDFQGLSDNRVNQDIIDTINSEERNQFGLLNNGVTIVGEKLKKSKGKYIIKNFQVVNGCQTSTILFQNKDKITEDMWVSVKLVITDDEEIVNKIVKATNNQTEVEEIQLYAMSEYQYLLESFYKNYEFKGENLYYERRKGQYNSNSNVNNVKVVKFKKQIKSFAAVFLECPHKSIRHFHKLVEEIENDIFVKGQKPILYYTSSYIRYRLINLFNNDQIEDKYHNFRYHIMMIIKKIVCKDKKMPQFNSKKIEEYCSEILNSIYKNEDFKIIVNQATDVLDAVLDVHDRENNKVEYNVNLINMYLDLNVTISDLKRYRAIIDEIETRFLLPFSKIKSSGDMRFNFINRLDDLIWGLKQYDFIDLATEIEKIKNNTNEDKRDERKEKAQKVHTKLNEFKEECNNKIQLSKRYIQKDI